MKIGELGSNKKQNVVIGANQFYYSFVRMLLN